MSLTLGHVANYLSNLTTETSGLPGLANLALADGDVFNIHDDEGHIWAVQFHEVDNPLVF